MMPHKVGGGGIRVLCGRMPKANQDSGLVSDCDRLAGARLYVVE